MRKVLTLLVLGLLLVMASACQTIGTQSDAASAQRYLPNIAGYTTTESDSIIDALTKAGFGTALASGNVPALAAIERADTVLQCMEETGAIAGRFYTEAAPSDIIPQAGAAIVVNRTRVNQNVLACLSRGRDLGGLGAQSVTIEPCASTGEFAVGSDEFTYIYVGVGNNLCGLFEQHFSNVKANNAT